MSNYKPTGMSVLLSILPRPISTTPSKRPLPFPFLLLHQPRSPTSLSLTLTEHDGLTESGEQDQRVGTGQFAHGKVDPHEAGKKGGEMGGSTGGQASGGNSGSGQFAGGKVDPVEAGKKGGQS
jgi:hypothetical protein